MTIKHRFSIYGFLIILLAIVTVWSSAVINTEYLERMPHVQDSVNYLFQAQIFSMGRLYMDAPEHADYFASELQVVKNNRWYSHYPFFVPFLFMIGLKLGITWLVNPIIAGLSVLLIYQIGKDSYNRMVGLWAAIFLVSSPFFMVMSASFMAHPTGLFLTAAALWFFIRQQKSVTMTNTVLLGLSLGLLLNTRPLTAFALTLPITGFHIQNRHLFSKRFVRHLTIYCLVLACCAAMFLTYSSLLSGKSFQFVTHTAVSETRGPSSIPLVNRFMNSLSAIGVGRQGHTPAIGLGTTRALLELLHTYTLNWPGWFNFSFFLIPLIPWRRIDNDRFFYWTFISIPLLYTLYWRSAIMYGPRYIYEVLPMIVILSARGLDVCADAAEWVYQNSPMKNWNTLSVAKPASLIVLYLFTGWLVYTNIDQYYISNTYNLRQKPIVALVPMRLSEVRYFNGIRRSIQDAVENHNISNAVVFVHDPRWQGFGSVASFNHPRLNTDVVYARDPGNDKYQAILDMFPGKTGYWTKYRGVELHKLVFNEEDNQFETLSLE
jgi:4-amino-4-deoxy-L-arabinose transferase-like glycosyltransferase